VKDYLDLARGYEAGVLDGSIPACAWTRKAVARNVRDRERVGSPGFPYVFDEQAATMRCFLSEQFPHIKGPLAKIIGQDDAGRNLWNTIALEPWQAWLQATVFGWKHAATGLRRFKSVLILVPRKNAKSTLGAVNLNLALTIDQEGGAEVYSAATTRDQAKVSAEIAWEMAKRTHAFREHFGIRIGAKTTRTIEVPETASKFMPLSADAHSLDGLNVYFALIDELHAHKTRAVYDVLETATGARSQPMLYAITTAGNDVHGICYEKLEYGRKVLDGTVDDDEFFVVEYTIDEGDDWQDERTWAKANPNLGVSVSLDDLKRKAKQAKLSPAARDNFLTKHLNVWVTSSSPCLSIEGWKAGQSTGWAPSLDVPELHHEPCWVGIDLAKKVDLCALTFAFPPTPGRPRWRWLQRIWTPADTLRERAIRDKVPYGKWVEQGWLIAHPGTSIDTRVVLDEILKARDLYDLQLIGFDPWHADTIIDSLKSDHGFADEMVMAVPQTYAGMSAGCLYVQARVLAGEIDAGGCPVTANAVACAVANVDGKENLMFAKGKSTGRIDPLISGAVATSLWVRYKPESAVSIYETRGLSTIG
jgi:phage terminase large subunit-like protein